MVQCRNKFGEIVTYKYSLVFVEHSLVSGLIEGKHLQLSQNNYCSFILLYNGVFDCHAEKEGGLDRHRTRLI